MRILRAFVRGHILHAFARGRGGDPGGRLGRRTRIGALAALALIAGVALAGFIAPLVVDGDALAPRIAAAVERATGRVFAMDGPIGFRLLPTPRLTLERVRLANREGGSETPFLAAKRLEAELPWGVLFGAPLAVKRLVLEGPELFLESSADQGWNWSLEPGTPDSAGPPPSDGALALDEIVVRDGRIEIAEPFLGGIERLDGVEAEVAFDRKTRKLKAEGRVSLFGVPLGFQIARGAPDDRGYAHLAASFESASGEAWGSFGGDLAPEGVSPRVAGALEIKGAKGTRLLAALPLAAPGPGLERLFGEPYRLAARLLLDARSIALEEVAARLGPLSGEGRFGLAASATGPKLDLAFELGQLDLDELLAPGEPAPAPSGGAAPEDTPPGPAGGSVEIALPPEIAEAPPPGPWDTLAAFIRNFWGDIDLGTRVLVWRNGIVREARLVASLEQGVLTVEQARALLPGGGDFALFGQVRNSDDGPAFDGEAEISADSLRATLEWLGLDPRAVPRDRLQRFDLSAKLEGSRAALDLSAIALKLDAAAATGSARVLFDDPLKVETDLSIDRLNADAYFPPDGTAEDIGEAKPRAFAPIAALAVPQFAGIALEGRARIGALVHDGATLRNLRLEARLADGKLWAEQAE